MIAQIQYGMYEIKNKIYNDTKTFKKEFSFL